jgi:uncharacterized protein YdbL (DUF1318 family)
VVSKISKTSKIKIMKLKTLLLTLCAGLLVFTSCTKEPTKIELTAAKTTITVGETVQIDVVYTPSNAKSDLIWESNNAAVATVSQSGKVTGIANGTAKITASTSNFLEATITIIVSTGGVVIPDGDGTQANPYSVGQLVAKHPISGAVATVLETGVWVNGYIVGGVKNTLAGGASTITVAEDIVWGATDVRPAAVVIADSPTCTDWEKVVIVKLTAETGGTVPEGITDIPLTSRPCNIGKTLKVQGNLSYYFGRLSVRPVTAFESNSEPCPAPEGLLSETLLTQASYDKFTVVDVLGALSWKFSSAYGAVMTGYDTQTHANEDWFISPAINLAGKTSAVLTFDHARGPAGSINVSTSNYTVWVSTDYTSGAPSLATWTQLTGINYGSTAWGYVSSGNVTIPADKLAATTRIAFKYVCDDTESATWEIKNLLVK